jgi:hypothetical protein
MIAMSRHIRKWLALVDHVGPRVRERRQRGHPYVYPTSTLVRCYLLMLINPRLRQYAALHTFLVRHPLVRWLVGLPAVPHRTTLSRRFQDLEGPLQARIWAMGLAFVLAGLVELHVLLADGTLHQAAGPSWPHNYKDQGVLPKGLHHVDQQAGWGKSSYRGWVWGYRSHVVVALSPTFEPIPLLMAAAPASVQDNVLLKEQLPWLPAESTVLLVDSSYEDETLLRAWLRTDDAGILDRWLVLEPRARAGRPADWRQQQQVWHAVEEHELYTLRGELIEPFFGHWKQAFQLDRLPFQGQAAKVFLLLAMYAYQLLIWDNMRSGRPTFSYQHMML